MKPPNKNEHISEKVFHKKVIIEIRKQVKNKTLPCNILLDGKIEGNTSKAYTCFSKRLGYVNDVADISIKNQSFDGTYNQLDIELKIGKAKPRDTQRTKLMSLAKRFNHFPCCVNTENGLIYGINKVITIIHTYMTKPTNQLNKFKLK